MIGKIQLRLIKYNSPFWIIKSDKTVERRVISNFDDKKSIKRQLRQIKLSVGIIWPISRGYQAFAEINRKFSNISITEQGESVESVAKKLISKL